jgi:hypothetical protein
MKRLAPTIMAFGIALGLAGTTMAYSLPPSYQAVFCYKTGSYWKAQVKAFPAYYAANNAYYLSAYGPGSIYCP